MKLLSKHSRSLSSKVLATVGTAFLVLSLGQYGIARSIVTRSYTKLEQKQALTNAERLEQAIARNLDELKALVQDWGWWTATYEYVQDRNIAYEEENLVPEVFLSLDLDFMIFLNRENRLVYAGLIDFEEEEIVEFPPAMLEDLLARTAQLDLSQDIEDAENQVVSGLALLDDKPTIIAAAPVLKSSSTGLPQGVLVMGRLMNSTRIADLSETTRLPTEAFLYDKQDLPSDLRSVKEGYASLNNTSDVQVLSNQKIASYVTLSDLKGQPGLILKTSVDREIYANGQASLKYYLGSTILVGLVSCALIMLLLRYLLLSRLESLSSQVDRIRQNQTDRRVQLKGADELSRLAVTINNTLEQLNQRTHELQLAKQSAEASKEAADRANHAKSAFLANMSHELRTPLNAILGFAQVLRKENSLSRYQREKLNIINSSGEHLLSLINDVLDMSKIESGQMELNPTSFDLHYLLETIRDMLQLKAHTQGLDLVVTYSKDLPRYLSSDERKLRQVLLNLLSNALKFTQEGSVTLSVESAPLADTSANKQRVTFAVTDTGAGISKAEIAQVFQPFVQTESGRTSQEGTGLGLPISRKFVELMGGTLTATSQRGKGSTFTFDIIAEVVDAAEIVRGIGTRQISALAPGQPTYRILIVDDNQLNRQLLKELLVPVGFKVREAANGQQAIEQWQQWEPHFIWMDMHMPVLDGYEATRQIKAHEKGQTTTIVALTASTLEEEQAIVLAAGCDDFMRKPFQSPALFAKIEKFLGVQYLYETPTAESDSPETKLNADDMAVALADMPPVWIEKLHSAALQLNGKEIVSLLAQIPDAEDALRQALEEKVQNFDFDQIEAIAQQAIQQLTPV